MAQNFVSIFMVWYGEPKGDVGAVGDRLASMSSDIAVNPAAKDVSGKGIGQR